MHTFLRTASHRPVQIWTDWHMSFVGGLLERIGGKKAAATVTAVRTTQQFRLGAKRCKTVALPVG